jgi:hypothetical protein
MTREIRRHRLNAEAFDAEECFAVLMGRPDAPLPALYDMTIKCLEPRC